MPSLSKFWKKLGRASGDHIARRTLLEAEQRAQQALHECMVCGEQTRWMRVGVVAGEQLWVCRSCDKGR